MPSIIFDAKSAAPYATNGAELRKADGTNFPIESYAFDATTQEQIAFKGRLIGYTSGTITVDVDWYADTATTNGIVLGAQLACVTPGDASNLETKALATATVSGTSNASGTAHGLVRATISITTNLDSAAADDLFILKLYRDVAAGGDTMTGDAQLVQITLTYS